MYAICSNVSWKHAVKIGFGVPILYLDFNTIDILDWSRFGRKEIIYVFHI